MNLVPKSSTYLSSDELGKPMYEWRDKEWNTEEWG